jgi:hypothetical protein
MLETRPVYGDKMQLGCTKVTFRFKDVKMQDQRHDLGECIGAKLMLYNYLPVESAYTLTYINDHGMVLKRIAYTRENVVEVCLEESICIVKDIPAKTPLKVV